MTVVLRLEDGSSLSLDRRLTTIEVAQRINETRDDGKLIEFQNNETPSRLVYVDPKAVVMVSNDGHPY